MEPWSGFMQTVAASPGSSISYGLLAANHPSHPIGPGAEGRLVLEFLDDGQSVVSETSSVILDSNSLAQIQPFTFDAMTPANAAWVRLKIERYTTDSELDLGGSFMADAVFLHSGNDTELPVFTSAPEPEQTVNTGANVDWSYEVSSPTEVSHQWYHNGERISTGKDLSFSSNDTSAGSYFVVATNEAGPVIGPTIELTVDAAIQDSDGDQISDSDELTVYGTDPNRPDSDFDGFSDYNELFLYLTDPLDPTSQLIITDFKFSGEQINLTFLTRPGVSYALGGSPDLASWQAIGSTFEATDIVSTLIVERPEADPPFIFFRVGPTN